MLNSFFFGWDPRHLKVLGLITKLARSADASTSSWSLGSQHSGERSDAHVDSTRLSWPLSSWLNHFGRPVALSVRFAEVQYISRDAICARYCLNSEMDLAPSFCDASHAPCMIMGFAWKMVPVAPEGSRHPCT